MSTPDGERTSARERAQATAVLRDALPAVLALVVANGLVGSVHLDGDGNRWDVALALLPLLPAAWLGWVQLRSLRRADEFQRLAQLEAMAVGFAVAAFLALGGGLLESAGVGSPLQSLQLTFIGSVLAWAGTLTVKLR